VFGIVQKLKPNGSKASRTFKNSDEDTPESILGKKFDFFSSGGALFYVVHVSGEALK